MENNISKEEIKMHLRQILDGQFSDLSDRDNTIKILKLPTKYGVAGLIKPWMLECLGNTYFKVEETSLGIKELSVPDDGSDMSYLAIPVRLEKLDLVSTGDEDEFAEKCDWMLICKGKISTANEYRFPVDVNEILWTDGELEQLIQLNTKDMNTEKAASRNEVVSKLEKIIYMHLPVIGWKVTKPAMRCKDKEYEMGVLYHADGFIEPHVSGYHFLLDKNKAFTYYPHFDPKNEIYLVQAGPYYLDGSHGVSVTNDLMFLKKLQWSDLLKE